MELKLVPLALEGSAFRSKFLDTDELMGYASWFAVRNTDLLIEISLFLLLLLLDRFFFLAHYCFYVLKSYIYIFFVRNIAFIVRNERMYKEKKNPTKVLNYRKELQSKRI